jgi:hypothetical protein
MDSFTSVEHINHTCTKYIFKKKKKKKKVGLSLLCSISVWVIVQLCVKVKKHIRPLILHNKVLIISLCLQQYFSYTNFRMPIGPNPEVFSKEIQP